MSRQSSKSSLKPTKSSWVDDFELKTKCEKYFNKGGDCSQRHEHSSSACAGHLHTIHIGTKKRKRAGRVGWERLLPDSEKEPLADIHDQMVLDERLPGYKGVYAKYGQVEINRPPIPKQLCPELVPAMTYQGKLKF